VAGQYADGVGGVNRRKRRRGGSSDEATKRRSDEGEDEAPGAIPRLFAFPFVATSLRRFSPRLSLRRYVAPSLRRYIPRMLHYFKFRQELFDPAAGRDVYIKRGKGRGWPEECPPIRAANAFGFDLLANFDVTFVQERGKWRVVKDVVIESDFDWASSDDAEGRPLVQQYAWFWQQRQKIPHVITDNVYKQISNQVKVSTFLFLQTDQNEMLLMTDVPNVSRPWRAMTALIETDWYPASYPWHCVIELDRSQKRIAIRKGEPLCRVVPVRRDSYFAKQMSPMAFDEFFDRGQRWLATHGKFEHEPAAPPDGPVAGQEMRPGGVADITRTYSRQQMRSKFVVMK
jgi:hypothetical protein